MIDTPPIPPWQIVVTAVEAAATLALAFFAAVQLWRERNRAKERKQGTDAQIGALAYLLRRQLRSWLGIESSDRRGLEGWLTDAITERILSTSLDTAEKRATRLAILAPEASVDVAKQLHKAFVLFLAATNRITLRAASPRPAGPTEFDWLQLLPDAEKDLRECLEALEARPVAINMLNAETILRRTRQQENPIYQLADVLAKLDHIQPTNPKAPTEPDGAA